MGTTTITAALNGISASTSLTVEAAPSGPSIQLAHYYTTEWMDNSGYVYTPYEGSYPTTYGNTHSPPPNFYLLDQEYSGVFPYYFIFPGSDYDLFDTFGTFPITVHFSAMSGAVIGDRPAEFDMPISVTGNDNWVVLAFTGAPSGFHHWSQTIGPWQATVQHSDGTTVVVPEIFFFRESS